MHGFGSQQKARTGLLSRCIDITSEQVTSLFVCGVEWPCHAELVARTSSAAWPTGAA